MIRDYWESKKDGGQQQQQQQQQQLDAGIPEGVAQAKAAIAASGLPDYRTVESLQVKHFHLLFVRFRDIYYAKYCDCVGGGGGNGRWGKMTNKDLGLKGEKENGENCIKAD